MSIISLHAKDTIAALLRKNIFLNIYSLGDLDDFFWPYTTWYGLQKGAAIDQLLLLYTAPDVPILLALTEPPFDSMCDFLRSVRRLLPPRVYAHLNQECVQVLAESDQVESHGLHYKMALRNTSLLEHIDTTSALPLSAAEYDDIANLYAISYPGNWFDPRMLESGYYYGIRFDGELVSIAGIHVYSSHYRVAALGNITTHPRARGRGLGAAATVAVCRALLPTVDYIGLNVKADNASAIACYEKLGFERVAVYEECALTLKGLR